MNELHRLLARLVRFPAIFGRSLVSRIRGSYLRVVLPGLSLGRNTRLDRGVRISIADGGNLFLGDCLFVSRYATILAQSGCLRIGKNGHVGIGAVVTAKEKVEIGDYCLIGEHVTIRDQDHDYTGDGPTARNGFTTAPIIIGNNVWIGAKATITKGVSIGDNAVIGANSVVTKDIPANTVAAGIPARVIKKINPIRLTD